MGRRQTFWCGWRNGHNLSNSIYSDGQKSCTFFLEFCRGPPGGVGPILELVDFVKWSPQKSSSSKFGPPSLRGGRKKIREKMCKTVTVFYNIRLIILSLVFIVESHWNFAWSWAKNACRWSVLIGTIFCSTITFVTFIQHNGPEPIVRDKALVFDIRWNYPGDNWQSTDRPQC